MKKTYIWIFVIILIIVNILLLWKTNQYKNNYNTLSEYLSKQKNNDSEFGEFYYDVIKDQYESNGLKININQCIVNSNGDSITIDKIAENGPKLIYNFKKVTCKICLDDELKRLKSISKIIGKNNIILIFPL